MESSSNVTPTAVKGVYRVSFPLRQTDQQYEEVVCFIRADSMGKLEINYSHTAHYARYASAGEWEQTMHARVDSIDPMFASVIYTRVTLILMSYFFGKVRILPGKIGDDLEEIEW